MFMRFLRVAACPILFCCMAVFAAIPVALAAEMRVAGSGGVNFREGASTDSGVIMTLSPGEAVQIIEHDPAGWSKVSASGAVGYVKSEYLTIPGDTQSVVFYTTGAVNFRSSPSTGAGVISSVDSGASVEVLEYDPAGWSRVRVGGTDGYIKSAYLALPAESARLMQASAGQGSAILKTVDGVNLRSGPSTEYSIIAVLERNTGVTVIERDVNGWSRVSCNGATGYIRSDLLSASGLYVELLDWQAVASLINYGEPIRCFDVRTGLTFYVKCFSVGDHADVEPATSADTETLLRTRNGEWSWSARPLWVTIGGRTIAASMHGMPHDVDFISGNGMDGHICMHFRGSTTSSTSESYAADLQNAVTEAWNAR